MNGEVCASEYMGNEVCKLFALTGGTVTWSMLQNPSGKQNNFSFL